MIELDVQILQLDQTAEVMIVDDSTFTSDLSATVFTGSING